VCGGCCLKTYARVFFLVTKLFENMICYQEAAANIQEVNADSRLKAWNKLSKIQQNVILLAGVDGDAVVQKEATEEMLSILDYQNRAQVSQYLKQAMSGHNICLEPGLCSEIDKGIFVHADNTSAPRMPFLTTPINDDEDVTENNNLLKLAVQTMLSENNVVLLTKMEIEIPIMAQELKSSRAQVPHQEYC